MAIPNMFSEIFALGQTIGNEDFFEQRIENDADGNPLYIGWCPVANGATSEEIWWIKKLHYDANGHVDWVQLPIGKKGFLFAWDDRATYF